MCRLVSLTKTLTAHAKSEIWPDWNRRSYKTVTGARGKRLLQRSILKKDMLLGGQCFLTKSRKWLPLGGHLIALTPLEICRVNCFASNDVVSMKKNAFTYVDARWNPISLNILRPEQNGRYFEDNIDKDILCQTSSKFVLKDPNVN